MNQPITISEFNNPLLTKFLIPIALILLLASKSFVLVDAGHTGVVKRLGAVQELPLSEGFHFKYPFLDTVIQVDIRLSNTKSEALSSSKDLQTVKTVVSVQSSINGEFAPSIYQKVGLIGAIQASVIQPAIEESVKAITAKYTAEQLITKRALVKAQIQDAIQEFMDKSLNEKGIRGGIQIANVAITDFNFSPEFDRAIELKVKAEQEALQAKNEKIRRVTQAEAAAAEKKLAAEAEAYQITVESKARAEAIRREAQSLKNNPALIQLRIAEKWNGKLPHFNGSSAIPFLDVTPASK